MNLIDTHCHLNHERFAGDVDAAIERAADAGVGSLIVVGFDVPSSEEAVRLAESDPRVWATVGVHPHDARAYDADAEARLHRWAEHPRVCAIGEIGLDFHYDFSPRDRQRAALRAQVALAEEHGLPVVFHCREAYAEMLDTLEERGAPRGVMHCWAGTPGEAARSVALGLHLGFGGMLTFRSAGDVRAAALAAPPERLLLETDAPYLAPVPHRGRRGEPAFTALVASSLAGLLGAPAADVAERTTANARALFSRLA